MRFVTLNTENDIPNYRKFSGKLEAELTEFMAMKVKCVKVTFTELEYKSLSSAYASISRAIKRHAFPIKAFTSRGKLYLIRTDMD